MSTPGQSRGAPPFDDTAADVLRQARGIPAGPQFALPQEWDPGFGYEKAELTDEERAEAQKIADEDARTCRYCLGVHRYPTSIGCPRIAEADLNADGKVTRVRFFEGMKWAQRVALVEDLAEEASDDGG